MDDIDVKIIKILRKNGRISMQHLAKEINMSGPAATDRVKKLEDAGIITGYGAHIDEAKLGRPLHAFITATVSIENGKGSTLILKNALVSCGPIMYLPAARK